MDDMELGHIDAGAQQVFILPDYRSHNYSIFIDPNKVNYPIKVVGAGMKDVLIYPGEHADFVSEKKGIWPFKYLGWKKKEQQ